MSTEDVQDDTPAGFLTLAPAPGDPTVTLPLQALPDGETLARLREQHSAPAVAAAPESSGFSASPKQSPPAKARRQDPSSQKPKPWPMKQSLPPPMPQSDAMHDGGELLEQELGSSGSGSSTVRETIAEEHDGRTRTAHTVKQVRLLKKTVRSGRFF